MGFRIKSLAPHKLPAEGINIKNRNNLINLLPGTVIAPLLEGYIRIAYFKILQVEVEF